MDQEMRQAVDFLYGIPRFTQKHSLEHTRLLMRRLGNPGKNCKVIHVAGSNGKGSVCCFLYHMLLYGGKTVGLFTSPHLTDIRERFCVNGKLCTEQAFLGAYRRVKAVAEELEQKKMGHPTFFEFIFAMGMLLFEQAQTEYVILETGLGGRLDATNSFPSPVLTVITSVSLEHTEILGDTIEQIAAEKAGIIKEGVPVICDANDAAASRVIRARAEKQRSLFVPVTKKMCAICEFKNNFIDFSLTTDYDKKTRWIIPSAAAWQVQNASLAVTAMRVLCKTDASCAVTDAQMRAGLQQSVWPGRMQEVEPEIYFDGAHNAAGIAAFVDAVRDLTKDDAFSPLLLFSMVKEKDYRTSAKTLTSKIDWEQVAVTTIPGERGISFEKLQRIFTEDTDRPVRGFADYREALSVMKAGKRAGQKLFCTGSLYFIGALMEIEKEEKND